MEQGLRDEKNECFGPVVKGLTAAALQFEIVRNDHYTLACVFVSAENVLKNRRRRC